MPAVTDQIPRRDHELLVELAVLLLASPRQPAPAAVAPHSQGAPLLKPVIGRDPFAVGELLARLDDPLGLAQKVDGLLDDD